MNNIKKIVLLAILASGLNYTSFAQKPKKK